MFILYGYSPLYNKDSDWVKIAEYETGDEAVAAKLLRISYGPAYRKVGGFEKYKVEEFNQ